MNNNNVNRISFWKSKGAPLLLIVAACTFSSGCSIDELVESISGIASNLTGGGGGGGSAGGSGGGGNTGGGGVGGGGGCGDNQICFNW